MKIRNYIKSKRVPIGMAIFIIGLIIMTGTIDFFGRNTIGCLGFLIGSGTSFSLIGFALYWGKLGDVSDWLEGEDSDNERES